MSRDCTTALQLGQQSKTLSQKNDRQIIQLVDEKAVKPSSHTQNLSSDPTELAHNAECLGKESVTQKYATQQVLF